MIDFAKSLAPKSFFFPNRIHVKTDLLATYLDFNYFFENQDRIFAMLKLHWRKAKVKVRLTTCVSLIRAEKSSKKHMQNKVVGVASRLYIAVVPLLGTVYRQINIKNQVDRL